MVTISTMDIYDAMDAIDTYGPNRDLWPAAFLSDMEYLEKNDQGFADYIADNKRIDDMLDGWPEGEYGVDVGEDSDSSGDNSDEETPVDQEMCSPGEDEEPEDEDDGPVIEMDPDQIKDMDQMFSDAIRKAFDGVDLGEFRVFTRDYDALIDIQGVTDQTSIESIDRAVAKSTGPLQKELRRMIASRSQVSRTPGHRKGRLHGPNLHRILSGDDRVFTRREEAPSLDTAISLVIDCSGSMSGDELNLASQTAYALGSVLSKLGISFECLGFTDDSQDPRISNQEYKTGVAEAHAVATITRHVPLTMPKFKTFDERWSQPVQRRFAHVFNNGGYGHKCGIRLGGTPEGCGVEFAARRLLQRKEARKIMLVMTDGSPVSHTYGGYGMNGLAMYQKQAADVVKAVELAGVDLVGIGICHTGPSEYYPNSMSINKLEDMPKKLLDLLKKFIVGK